MGGPFIGPPGGPPLRPSTALSVPELSRAMQTQVLTLVEQLQKLLDDPSLSQENSFLKQIASNGNQLYQTIEKVSLVR